MLKRIIEVDVKDTLTDEEKEFAFITYRDRGNGTYVVHTNKLTDKTGLMDGKEMVALLVKVLEMDAPYLNYRAKRDIVNKEDIQIFITGE